MKHIASVIHAEVPDDLSDFQEKVNELHSRLAAVVKSWKADMSRQDREETSTRITTLQRMEVSELRAVKALLGE